MVAQVHGHVRITNKVTSMVEKGLDFNKMTLAQVEDLVGRKPYSVEIRNRHVIATFDGLSSQQGDTVSLGAPIRVLFKKW